MNSRFAAVPVVILFLLAFASPAFAAVSISPSTAEQGDTALVSFRITNTSVSATTNQVVIELPTASPFASVAVQPHAGWSYEFTRSGGVITGITWTSTSNGELKPGEFDQFNASIGPLPTDTDALIFKVVQKYSDGTTESPDLSINLNAANVSVAAVAPEAPTPPTPQTNKDRSNAALAISLVALTFAVGALLATLAALARHKS